VANKFSLWLLLVTLYAVFGVCSMIVLLTKTLLYQLVSRCPCKENRRQRPAVKGCFRAVRGNGLGERAQAI